MFRRLLAGFLALLALAMAILGFLFEPSARRRILQDAETRLRSEAELLRPVARSRDLQAVVHELGKRTGTRFTVIAPEGTALADSQATPAETDNFNALPEVRDARKSGQGLQTRHDRAGVPVMHFAVRLDPERPDGVVVRTSLPLDRLHSERRALYAALAAAFAITALAGTLLVYALTCRMARPLNRILEVTQAISTGDFSRKLKPDSRGKIAAVTLAVNRMSDEIAARMEATRQEKAKLESVLSSMREAVLALDASGTVLHHNEAAKALFGITVDPAGLKAWEVVRDPDLRSTIERVLRDGKPQRMTLESGARAAAVSVASIGEGRGAVLVARDVTEERSYEELRREFVANASHELRTPLALIRGFVEALQDGAVDDRAKARDYLATIAKHVDQLTNLVSDLLDLSRLESNSWRPKKMRINLEDPVRKAVEALQPAARRKAQSILLELPEAVPDVAGDPDFLERAIQNLVDNAIKYTPEGGEIRVALRAEGTNVATEVSDNGIGIPAEDLPRVFERFYRVDKSRSREMGGTGLGLSIVKHIVQEHGGTISASSQPGRGSVFRMVLPAIR
ncbi:MAG: PAS domain-containing protein [Planctomycetes bacterium]|nr:PAS domain-containing protein [Planctomycetota bacterium]